MKFFKVTALILAMIILFSGCSLNFFSVESLLAPPAQGGKNGEIQEAFNDLMKDQIIQLKAPVSGEYQTAYILYDLNNDGDDEALVFYSDTSTEGSVRVAIMECVDDEWKINVDIKGAGNGIYDVNFVDINKDDVCEVFISWTLMDSKTTRIVSIFSVGEDSSGACVLNSIGNEYGVSKEFLDFNFDGNTDLALVYIDDTDNVRKSYLRFFSLDDKGNFSKFAEVSIDGNILSVSGIESDTIVSGTTKYSRIFVDCLKSEKTIFTEMVYWDKELSLPVRAYSNPAFTTARNNLIRSRDIDGDGLIEIPVLATLYGIDSSVSVNRGDDLQVFTMIDWTNVKGDSSEDSIKTLFNPIDGYLFKFIWEDKVTIKYDSAVGKLFFCQWDEETKTSGNNLFTISYRSEKDYVEDTDDLGTLFYESPYGDYYYEIFDSGVDFGITEEMIKTSFIILN